MPKTFLKAKWEHLIMANYAIPPSVLMPYLPYGVELDLFNGSAYASLVGFMFNDTKLFNVPIPFLGTFEEVNLRFYVKRIQGSTVKRGVVFINETVPYQPVAWLANKLYQEHYIAIPTRNTIKTTYSEKKVRYEWKAKNKWNHVEVVAETEPTAMLMGSFEEFIFEHYFGYTKLTENLSQEYYVNHPRWQVHEVKQFDINCDFTTMYRNDFSFLNHQQPDKVMLAQGSEVTVDWRRIRF
ncbi:MAG: YqjF family protein [Cytophagales bacterium]